MPIVAVGTPPPVISDPGSFGSFTSVGTPTISNPSGFGSDSFTTSSITPVGEPPQLPPTEPPPVGEQPISFFDKVSKLIGFGEFSIGSLLKGAGIGAAINGVVSGVKNVIALSKKECTKAKAIGNVIGDVFTGAVGGLGFALGSNISMMGFRALGIVGLPLTIAGVVCGTVTAIGAGKLLSGVKNTISNSVSAMLGDKSYDNNEININEINPPKILRVEPAS